MTCGSRGGDSGFISCAACGCMCSECCIAGILNGETAVSPCACRVDGVSWAPVFRTFVLEVGQNASSALTSPFCQRLVLRSIFRKSLWWLHAVE